MGCILFKALTVPYREPYKTLLQKMLHETVHRESAGKQASFMLLISPKSQETSADFLLVHTLYSLEDFLYNSHHQASIDHKSLKISSSYTTLLLCIQDLDHTEFIMRKQHKINLLMWTNEMSKKQTDVRSFADTQTICFILETIKFYSLTSSINIRVRNAVPSKGSSRTEKTLMLRRSPGTIAITDWQEIGFTKRNSHQAPSASFHCGLNTLAATHAALLTTTTQGTKTGTPPEREGQRGSIWTEIRSAARLEIYCPADKRASHISHQDENETKVLILTREFCGLCWF